MVEIKMGGRDIPLYLSTLELVEIQKDIGCTVAQLKDEVFGLWEDEEDLDENGAPKRKMKVAVEPELMKRLGILIRILGNAGLEEAGQEPNLTDKWILRHMKPGLIMGYALAAWGAVLEGMLTESAEIAGEDQEKGPVDVTIEESNRKKEPEK